ncbi:MAG: peptidoglycan editing factor PgeF [Pseudomonadota bacterium]
MTAPPHLTSTILQTSTVAHGFFSRIGGVSDGIYAFLNVGPGSDDAPENILENRKRCAEALGAAPERLLTTHQIHSAEVVHASGPWPEKAPKADAAITTTPGVALGVLAADCMPWLFADPDAGVIAAAHAGWRGALAGVLENTIEIMESFGADRARIRAALGPCLRQQNFEVGLDLLEAFVAKHEEAERFFAPGDSSDKRQFDLAGFGAWRLRRNGVEAIDDLNVCTLGQADRYFSYRASKRRNEPDYGRNLSAICLS